MNSRVFIFLSDITPHRPPSSVPPILRPLSLISRIIRANMFRQSSYVPSLWWSRPHVVPPILSLPDELLTEIAIQSRPWSPPLIITSTSPESDPSLATTPLNLHRSGCGEAHAMNEEPPVCLPTHLANFSATSRIFRDITVPILFRDVHVTSAKRLRALAACKAHQLACIR